MIDWFTKGLRLLENGEREEALACFDRATEADPEEAVTWAKKGTVLGMIGEYERGLECLDRATRIDPRFQGAWLNKGVLLGKHLERPEEAIACFDRVIELNPGHAEAWRNRGAAMLAAGRPRDALEQFEEADRLGDPEAESGIEVCKKWMSGE